VVDQIRVDRVLEVPAAEIREEDVDRFLAAAAILIVSSHHCRSAAAGRGDYGVVDGRDEVCVAELSVALRLFHRD